MKVLLDTHALIWAVDEPAKLGAKAKTEMSNSANDLLISAASIWGIAIKVGLGKLNLPITIDYADAQAKLPHHHGDPFDRLLVAQAQTENAAIASSDVVFDAYGLTRIW